MAVAARMAPGAAPVSRVVILQVDQDGVGRDSAISGWVEAEAAGCLVTLMVKPLRGVRTEAPALVEALAAFMERAGRDGVRPRPSALALPAAFRQPEELALEAAAACPGPDSLMLMLPATALEAVQRRRSIALHDGNSTDARRWWGRLLALAAVAPAVSLVPGVAGSGLAPVAARRGWAGPTPGLAELVPEAPRRLRVDLDFGRLLEKTGGAPAELARLAAEQVADADARLGPGNGPRRLALHLTGVGRAVARSGFSPSDFGALKWLSARLAAFRAGARAASVALARRLGAGGGVEPFPVPGGLEVADTGVLERAVLRHGARHSHLVCLSPWSLADPSLGREGLGLLSALEWADSVAWRRPEETMEVAYGEVLRYAWAVAQAE
ncbi:MAG: hypothetical protein P8102_01070 [Gammaproteobacteria bacterium]